jgi:hypothetical protein
MNVYITGTPEVSNKKINQVVEILNKVNGPLIFHYKEKLNKDSLLPNINLEDEFTPIYFDELNQVADLDREYFNFSGEDFYVILTSHKLDIAFNPGKTWFSYFNNKNIFVRTYGWEEYTNRKTHIAIAHQVIENIFQSLSGYKYGNYEGYHEKAKGCLNDFCKNEYEIEFKLRTGYICKKCLQVAVDNSTSIEILTLVKTYLNFFRDELLDFKSILETIEIPTLSISSKGHISIGGNEIEIEYVPRTFYIFSILNRGREITFNYLKENQEKLSSIYRTIKKTGSDRPIQTFLGTEIDVNGNNFVVRDYEKTKKLIRNKRNEIKTDLKAVIGDELSEIFKIGSTRKFIDSKVEHCSIFPENERLIVEIDPEFLEMI